METQYADGNPPGNGAPGPLNPKYPTNPPIGNPAAEPVDPLKEDEEVEE